MDLKTFFFSFQIRASNTDIVPWFLIIYWSKMFYLIYDLVILNMCMKQCNMIRMQMKKIQCVNIL